MSFRWGILGCGSIARKFATGLKALDDAQLVAVGSRTQDNADAFGNEFDVPARHSSYQALAEDPLVDAVYVATPHPMHKDNSILCLENGKAVLCEKPFTVNEGEARELIAVAREKNVFLMEAMWTRFLPVIIETRKRIADGEIGEVRMVSADFGFRANVNPEGRLFSPSLAGGALLDIGVYTVSFASMIMGAQPSDIAGGAQIGETGVDEQGAMVFGYGEAGRLALLSCAIRARTPHDATIIGTDGYIRLPKFWSGTEAVLVKGNNEEVIEAPYEGNGYNCEAEEVARCVQEGKTESDIMPLDETLAIMNTLDRIRSDWGLKYPMEQQ